jgi:predicted nicotinamide N-methyase
MALNPISFIETMALQKFHHQLSNYTMKFQQAKLANGISMEYSIAWTALLLLVRALRQTNGGLRGRDLLEMNTGSGLPPSLTTILQSVRKSRQTKI